jgi:prevent-host-death family protein
MDEKGEMCERSALMASETVTLTQLKRNLGEIVNRVAYGKRRVVLLSRGKEHAAIIGIEDLRRLEALEREKQHEVYAQRQQSMLDQARALRERMLPGEEAIDSARVLDEVREERLDDLMDLR